MSLDLKDHRGYEVLVHYKKYNDKYNIVPLMEPILRRIGLYRRSYRVFPHDTKQRYDQFDNKPFSTDFTFTRFLVPALNQYQGWALFMDWTCWYVQTLMVSSKYTMMKAMLLIVSNTSIAHQKGLS